MSYVSLGSEFILMKYNIKGNTNNLLTKTMMNALPILIF